MPLVHSGDAYNAGGDHKWRRPEQPEEGNDAGARNRARAKGEKARGCSQRGMPSSGRRGEDGVERIDGEMASVAVAGRARCGRREAALVKRRGGGDAADAREAPRQGEVVRGRVWPQAQWMASMAARQRKVGKRATARGGKWGRRGCLGGRRRVLLGFQSDRERGGARCRAAEGGPDACALWEGATAGG